MNLGKFSFVGRLLIVLVVLTTGSIRAEEVGFVKKGAFVIPAKVNVELLAHQTRLRVGYLPVGSVVWIGECFLLTENASTGLTQEKKYCKIESEVGISGLLRYDRFHVLSKPVVIALANEQIPVYPIQGTKPYAPFSRNSGVYVDVTGKISNGKLPVLRPYTEPKPLAGYLKIEELGDKVRYLDPTALKIEKANFKGLLDYSEGKVSNQFGDVVLDYFSEIRKAIQKLETKLNIVSNVACLIEGEVFAKLGVSFLGSAAGAKISAKLKQGGETFGFDATVLSVGNSRSLISSINRYACTSPPFPEREWMIEFISVGAPQNNPTEILQVIGNREQEQIHVIPDDPKIFKIRSWEDYERSYSHLLREMSQKNFVRLMNDQQRIVHTHYVLSKIADFQSR